MHKKIIGSFLGARGTSGVSICIALPDHDEIKELVCTLIHPNGLETKIKSQPKYDPFRLFQFNQDNLEINSIYKYKFSYQNEELDLGEGLTYEDCKFKVLGDDKDGSFILLSCNNPFATEKGSSDDGWGMWNQMESFLSKKDHNVRLIVMGGDQVYNDELEKEFIKKNLSDEKIQNHLRNEFINSYYKHWNNTSYRKIFASIPSLAMWDDHDITDGWGSRKESFDKKNNAKFKQEWWEYFKIAKEAFSAYQNSRNHKKIPDVPNQVFSSFLDWGENRFILCDFRSERNSSRKLLWSNEHKKAVLDFLKNSPDKIKRIFFLTPVIALRTNFKGDRRLSTVSSYLFKLRKYLKNRRIKPFALYIAIPLFVFSLFSPKIASVFIRCSSGESCNQIDVLYIVSYFLFSTIIPFLGALALLFLLALILVKCISKIKELPDLSDDMTDGLSSDANMESLKEMLDCFMETINKHNKEIYILSGDIHLAGLTEIIDTREKDKKSVLQIVSSPIAYKPMPKVISGLTTTTSEMVLRECNNTERLFARNIFYVSKRNFVQIIPSKLSQGTGIKFFLEDHQIPVSFPKKFY